MKPYLLSRLNIWFCHPILPLLCRRNSYKSYISTYDYKHKYKSRLYINIYCENIQHRQFIYNLHIREYKAICEWVSRCELNIILFFILVFFFFFFSFFCFIVCAVRHTHFQFEIRVRVKRAIDYIFHVLYDHA